MRWEEIPVAWSQNLKRFHCLLMSSQHNLLLPALLGVWCLSKPSLPWQWAVVEWTDSPAVICLVIIARVNQNSVLKPHLFGESFHLEPAGIPMVFAFRKCSFCSNSFKIDYSGSFPTWMSSCLGCQSIPSLNTRNLTGLNPTTLNFWDDGKMSSWCFGLLHFALLYASVLTLHRMLLVYFPEDALFPAC